MCIHIVLFLCIGDDFASAHSLLEAVFALEEETSPLRRAENSGGNVVQALTHYCSHVTFRGSQQMLCTSTSAFAFLFSFSHCEMNSIVI